MAEYPIITLLSELNPLIPGETEDANKLGSASRQLRQFLTTWLAEAHNDDGSLKDASIPSGALSEAAVRGSDADGSQNEILQGSIRSYDMADGAVTSAKLASEAVTTAKIDDEAVTEAKLGDNAVTTDKIKDGEITHSKLTANAVEGDNIKADAINSTHIADDAVEDNHVDDGALRPGVIGTSIEGLMVPRNSGGGGVMQAMEVHADSQVVPSVVGGYLYLSLANSLTAASLSFVHIEERWSDGTGGGSAVAATWNTRGGSGSFYGVRDVLGCFPNPSSGAYLTCNKAGNYVVHIRAAAYSVGLHRLRLEQDIGGSVSVLCYGSPVTAPDGIQSIADLVWSGALAVGTKLIIKHYTQYAKADIGLGLPASHGVTENYMVFEAIKV